MKIVNASDAVQREVALEADFYYAQTHSQCLLGQDLKGELAQLVNQVSSQIRVIAGVMKDPQFAAKSLIKNDTFVMIEHKPADDITQHGILAWQEQKLKLFIETSQIADTVSFMTAFVDFVTANFVNKKNKPTSPSAPSTPVPEFDDDGNEIVE